MKYTFLILFIAFVLSVNVESCYPAKIREESPAKKFYRELSSKLSKNRNDYPNLSDEEFANFREVQTTGIGKNKLYRSSSPINDWGNRNLISDNLSRITEIKTFINLVDTDKKMRSYNGFSQTYYSTQTAIALNIDLKFHSRDFQNKLVRGLKFIADNEPPFLIHCNLGKDRTGFVCAIIECLMGASHEEIIADYTKSFYNYFGIISDTEQYDFIVNKEIRPILASILNVKSIESVNLSSAAERYLIKIGMNDKDIAKIRAKLR